MVVWVAKTLCVPFTSWHVWVTAAAALAVAGGLGYWFHDQIASACVEGLEAVVAALGLGVAPVSIWIGVLLWALARRRSWFRRVNLWVGSLILVTFILGILSFFQPYYGTLAVFTLDGEVTLGGDVGYTVAGPVVWEGALRAFGLFLLGMVIAAPSLSLYLATAIGRLLVFSYVLVIVAIKGMTSAVKGMYRFEPASSPAKSEDADDLAESIPPTRDLGTDAPGKATQVSRARVEELVAGMQAAAGKDEKPGPEFDESETAVPNSGSDSTDRIESRSTQLAISGNNRLLSANGYRRDGENSLANRQEGTGDDADEGEGGVGPIPGNAAASWALPRIDLLSATTERSITNEEMAETADTIKQTLSEYGIEVEVGQIKPGPTVTMYGLIPGWVRRQKQVRVTDEHGNPKLDESGKPVVTRVETKMRVKVDSILSREKDLALALKTPSIRIETPVLGKSLVGIEVPNSNSTLVTLRSTMESTEFKRLRSNASLPVILGKASGGESVVVDLADMPHLLIAGATGSGKSVCINAIVSCLIMVKTPAEMRLLLVDPKRVELTAYNGIPHLLTPVVVETDRVVALLKGLIREMMIRYRRLEEVRVRNIDSYNKKVPERMPYIVVAVDELADLMMSASFDVEQTLCRLAQLGRATGIHLIVATQRPSVDVVTGLIKANFPSRVSFGVTSHIDSRTILDTPGAEKLLGRGDMLYLAVDAPRPERAQGVYISDREIENLVRFWQTTPRPPLPRVSLYAVGDDDSEEEDAGDGGEHGSRDEFLDKAIELAHTYNKLSTSLLQRRLRIGYPRAARLMDQLEEEGIVGPPGEGSKSRDVLIGKQ